MTDDTKTIHKLNNRISALIGIVNAHNATDALQAKLQSECGYCHEDGFINYIMQYKKSGYKYCPHCGRELRDKS